MTAFRVYWRQRGSHVHMSLFVNGAKAGELILRNEEFDDLVKATTGKFSFVKDDE